MRKKYYGKSDGILLEERSGSAVEGLTQDQGVAVQTSLEALHCILEQDTLSSD